MSNSEEEEIARNFICFENNNVTIVVVDATSLERNLNLVYQVMEITNNIVICVNLLDEAEKKGIHINLDLLERFLGVPVVGTIARKKKTLNNLMDKVYKVCTGEIICNSKIIKYPEHIENSLTGLTKIIEPIIPSHKKHLSRWISLKLLDNDEKIIESINKNIFNSKLKENNQIITEIKKLNFQLYKDNSNNDILKDTVVSSILKKCEKICKYVCTYEKSKYTSRDIKIDKILTSKTFGLPIMILFLFFIFWLTIIGSNFPSQLLAQFFSIIGDKIKYVFEYLSCPKWISNIIFDGVYSTLTWVISVMLPPMAIFFPLFTLLEDLGYLPRIAFNLDKFFKKASSSRKAKFNNVYADLVVMLVELLVVE